MGPGPTPWRSHVRFARLYEPAVNYCWHQVKNPCSSRLWRNHVKASSRKDWRVQSLKCTYVEIFYRRTGERD